MKLSNQKISVVLKVLLKTFIGLDIIFFVVGLVVALHFLIGKYFLFGLVFLSLLFVLGFLLGNMVILFKSSFKDRNH